MMIFILERCPRCLAPLGAPLQYERHRVVDGGMTCCILCFYQTPKQARAEYDRRLAAGRVVPTAHETREANTT